MSKEFEQAIDVMVEQPELDPEQVDIPDEEPEGPMTIDMTPTWEATVLIYMSMLENPDAPPQAKIAAKEEITRLAKFVDNLKREGVIG